MCGHLEFSAKNTCNILGYSGKILESKIVENENTTGHDKMAQIKKKEKKRKKKKEKQQALTCYIYFKNTINRIIHLLHQNSFFCLLFTCVNSFKHKYPHTSK